MAGSGYGRSSNFEDMIKGFLFITAAVTIGVVVGMSVMKYYF